MKNIDWIAVGALVLGACGGPTAATDAGPGDSGEHDAYVAVDAATHDAGTDDAGGSDAGSPGLLTNLAAGCSEPSGAIGAVLPEEAGHWAATRLEPSTYPFRVTSIDYAVGHPAGMAPECDGGLAHRVRVYVIDGVVPGPTPSTDGSLVRSFDVPAETVTNFRFVHRELSPPIELTTGQSIVVAIEESVDDAAAPTTVCCVGACPGNPSAVPGVDYWSSAADEPYAWADLVTEFDFPSNLWITASGEPL